MTAVERAAVPIPSRPGPAFVRGPAPPRGERTRQLVHVGSLAFAVLLRWLAPWQAIAFGAGAVAFNLWALPHVGRSVYRAGERPGRLSGGVMVYPVVVLLLVAVVGAAAGRMDVAAGAWAAMAVGDGLATLVGRTVRGPALPWQPAKTWAGTGAFAVSAWAAIAVFAHWTGGWTAWTAHPVPLLWAAALAAIAGAAVESLPLPVDDNWSVPAVTAAVLLVLAGVEPAALAAAITPERALVGIAVAAGLGVVALAARSVGLSGLVGGIVLGAATWAASGGWAFGALAAFFVVGSIATHLGRRAKERRGLVEGRGGRRGARHAWANGLAGLVFAALAASTAGAAASALRVAAVAAYATAAADTVATEIGQWLGGPTVSARSGRRVAPGTPGGVGLAGTIAGLVAGALVAAAGVALGAIRGADVPVVVAAAAIGSLAESALGARVPPGRRTPLAHDALNLTNTVAGGVVALALARGLI